MQRVGGDKVRRLGDRFKAASSIVAASTLDLFFPPRCVVCDAAGPHLCDVCLRRFQRTVAPRCERCWTPGRVGLCERCLDAPPAFRALRASFVFRDAIRDAIHAVKYRGLSVAAEDLVEAARPLEVHDDVQLVVTVPMAGRRRRLRGYNQAELIARAVAKRLGLPCDATALHRVRSTAQQAGLDLEHRRENVEGAFRADRRRVAGRTVLLVDDVTTSGATLDACARALLAAGATAVDAWALARED